MLSNSRQQFLASESRDGILFERKGWYVSRWVCCLLAATAVLGALIVGVAAFYISREKSLFNSHEKIWTESNSMTTTDESSHYRLPTSVVPSFYRLKFVPNLGNSIFNGEVYITLKTADSDVNKIILHSKGLNIQKPIKVTEQVYEKIQNVRKKRSIPEKFNTEKPESLSADQAITQQNATDSHMSNKNVVTHHNGTEIKDSAQASETNASVINLKHKDTDRTDYNRNSESKLSTDHSKLNHIYIKDENQTSISNFPVDDPKYKEVDKKDDRDKTVSNSPIEHSKYDKTIKEDTFHKSESNAPTDHSKYNDTEEKDANQKHTTNKNYTIITASEVKSRKTQVTQSHTKNVNVTHFQLDESKETMIIYLARPLEQNTDYTLEITFNGNITDALNGFYKSSYDDNKETKVMAITQFEPTHARAAFPCFDEPKFKAMFEISIAHSKNLTALSNMPITETEPMSEQPGWSWTHYARSVKMSTYLVAYGVMDLDFLETSYRSTDETTKTIRVWMKRDLKLQGHYALNITPKLLMFYEKLFGLPYALKKVDLIAIPDFSAGAMENWGLITFRETSLLLEKDGTISQRWSIASSVSHELAHQWFGNLVTMSWWNDLWLNEGFATYVQYLGVNHVEPQWNILEKLTSVKIELLRMDALKHTTPVSMAVDDTSEISQKFNDITYQKGASIISMLNHTITEKLFLKGLVAYLNKWKFSNAEENDLWFSMSEAVASADPKAQALNGIDVVKFMNSWTRQAGYPVLAVKRHYNGSVTFMQTLFTTAQSSKVESIWTIPITYTSVDAPRETWSTTPRLWLQDRNNTVELPLKNEQALYVNVDGIGYYRVNYDEENWRRLMHTLKHNVSLLPPITRAQLIDDAFNLAKVSLLSYDTALNLTAFLPSEQTRTVWEMLFSNLSFLMLTLRNTPHYSNFQDYVLRLLTPILKKHQYGIDNSTDEDAALLRETLLQWECVLEAPRCIHWAQKLFQQWMDNADFTENPIPSNVRSIVYSTAVRHGGRAEFDFLWRVFTNSSEPSTAETALGVLGSTRDDSLMRLLLERSLTEIPAQNADIAWSLDSAAGQKLSQEFFIENWARIYAKFNKMDSFVLRSIISGAFGGIYTQQDLDRYEHFVEEHYDELRPQRQSLLEIADGAILKINWLRTHANTVGAWLTRTLSEISNSTSTGATTTPNENRDRAAHQRDSKGGGNRNPDKVV